MWLCGRHAADAYAVRERGELFVRRLASVWAAAGALTRRRMQALEGHLTRVDGRSSARERPGSYSWPKLRREAERRFAAGDAPDAVITELRHRHADGPAMAPSVRTMRRWFAEARWLALPLGSRPKHGRPPGPRPGPPTLARALAGIALYPLFPLPDFFAHGP